MGVNYAHPPCTAQGAGTYPRETGEAERRDGAVCVRGTPRFWLILRRSKNEEDMCLGITPHPRHNLMDSEDLLG